jgi:hypothetical protein
LIRLLGAGIVLDSALTLNGSLSLFRSPTTYTAAFSTTIPAGVYDLFSFAAKVNSLLRQALIDDKHASITAPSLANVRLKFVFPATWSSTPGANKIVVTFDPTGFLVTAGSLQTTILAFSLTNGTGTWCSKLGLIAERTASIAATLSPASPNATLATITGLFQPRSIYCFENSFTDSWDSEVRPEEKTIHLRNGKVRTWSLASAEAYRTIVLVDHPEDMTGPPLDAMTFSSFGVDRGRLTFHDPDESGLTNASDIHSNYTLVADDIVRVGNDDFFARVASLSATQVLLAENYPASIVPTAGDTIWKISEAHALWIEAYRTGYLFVYEPDESGHGRSKFKALAYALDLNGRIETNFQRRDLFVSLYSVTFPLTRRDTPETALI